MFYKSLFYKSMFYKSMFYKSTFYKSMFYKSMFYKSSPCFTNPIQSMFYNMPKDVTVFVFGTCSPTDICEQWERNSPLGSADVCGAERVTSLMLLQMHSVPHHYGTYRFQAKRRFSAFTCIKSQTELVSDWRIKQTCLISLSSGDIKRRTGFSDQYCSSGDIKRRTGLSDQYCSLLVIRSKT